MRACLIALVALGSAPFGEPQTIETGIPSDLYSAALLEVGVTEVEGTADNQKIVEYWISAEGVRYPDSRAWCSAFAIAIAKRVGADTNGANAWARSWLNVGKKVEQPKQGDVVVLSRGAGGHVGFFAEETHDRILILGGNQSDAVTFEWYDKSRVLGIRRLTWTDS